MVSLEDMMAAWISLADSGRGSPMPSPVNCGNDEPDAVTSRYGGCRGR